MVGNYLESDIALSALFSGLENIVEIIGMYKDKIF